MTSFEELMNSYLKGKEKEPYGKYIKPGIYEYTIDKIYVKDDNNMFAISMDLTSVNSRINNHSKIRFVSLSEKPIFRNEKESSKRDKITSMVYKSVLLCNILNIPVSDIDGDDVKNALKIVIDRISGKISGRPLFIAIDKNRFKGRDGKYHYNFYIAEGRTPIAERYDLVSAIFKWNESEEEEKERKERMSWLSEDIGDGGRERNNNIDNPESYDDMPWLH